MDKLDSIVFNVDINPEQTVKIDIDKSIERINESFAKLEKTYFEDLSKTILKYAQVAIGNSNLSEVLQNFSKMYSKQISEILKNIDLSSSYKRIYDILNAYVGSAREQINKPDIPEDIKESCKMCIEDVNNQITETRKESKFDINKISLILSILIFIITFLQNQINSNSSQKALDEMNEKFSKEIDNQQHIISLLMEKYDDADASSTSFSDSPVEAPPQEY